MMPLGRETLTTLTIIGCLIISRTFCCRIPQCNNYLRAILCKRSLSHSYSPRPP